LTNADQAVLQTFNIKHIMNKQTIFITYSTFAKDFSLVIVTIGYMPILFEKDVDELGCITSHMLRTTTI